MSTEKQVENFRHIIKSSDWMVFLILFHLFFRYIAPNYDDNVWLLEYYTLNGLDILMCVILVIFSTIFAIGSLYHVFHFKVVPYLRFWFIFISFLFLTSVLFYYPFIDNKAMILYLGFTPLYIACQFALSKIYNSMANNEVIANGGYYLWFV
jgi:hypothetical protein